MNRIAKSTTFALTSLLAFGAVASIEAPASALPKCNPAIDDCPLPPPPPPPPPPPVSFNAFPHYQVVTILYAPPGNKSKVTYGNGSTAGNTNTTKSSFSDSVSVTAGVPGFQVTGGFTVGFDSSSAVKVSKQASTTLTANSQGDTIDHDNDVFIVWVNPKLTFTERGSSNVSLTGVGMNGSFMNIVPITVAQLKDPTTIPAAYKPLLTKLTPADYTAMLGLDPYAIGAHPDAGRFVPTGTSLPIDGTIVSSGSKEVDSSTITSSQGWNTSYSVGMEISAGIGFVSVFKESDKFTWSDSSSTESSNTSDQSIEASLATSNPSFAGLFNVYYDKQFHSFVFVNAVSPPVVTGILTGIGGVIADERVTLAMPDGSIRTTYTNGKGEYSFADVPEGTGYLEAMGTVKQVPVKTGILTTQHLVRK